jgi:hypothetical protein
LVVAHQPAARQLVALPEFGEREVEVLARTTGQRFAMAVMQFPDYRSDEAGAEGQPAWVEQMADGFRPLTDSVSGAWHALRRTVPAWRDETRL